VFGSAKELAIVVAIIAAAAVLVVIGARFVTHPKPHHRPAITNEVR
jgi:hypothetical protein